jgi:hypothetical protein
MLAASDGSFGETHFTYVIFIIHDIFQSLGLGPFWGINICGIVELV